MRRKSQRVRVSGGHLCEAEAPTESETRLMLRIAICLRFTTVGAEQSSTGRFAPRKETLKSAFP